MSAGPAPGGSDDINPLALQLPLLVAGLPGTGKTTELVTQALAHTWRDMANGVSPRRTLCLAAHNTAVTVLRAKMTKGASLLDQSARAASRRQHRDDDDGGGGGGDDGLSQQVLILTPSQRPGWLETQFDTIHHACRRLLIRYGHLVGWDAMGEVCSEKRALLILETLQSEQVFDFSDEHGGVGAWDLDSGGGLAARMDAASAATKATLQDDLSVVAPDDAFLRAAVQCAQRCRRRQMTAGMLQEVISEIKMNNFSVSEELRDRHEESALDAAEEMREFYDALLRHNKLYDFDDLIVHGLRLVRGHAQHIVETEKIGLIVLDDVHNTSASQRQFVRALAGEGGTNGRLMVACEDMRLSPSFDDAEQSHMSTYRFSGAPSHINPHELMQECLDAGQGYVPWPITANWRSTPIIQHVAYEMLSHHVVDVRQTGAQKPPYLCAFASIRDEARFICDEADRIHIEDDARGRDLSSIAVIARRNEDVRFLVDELVNMERPVRVMGQENSDLSSDEALNLISFLAAAQNPMLHHLVDRALVVFRRCVDRPQLSLNDLPDADVLGDYLADEEAEPVVSDAIRPFLDVLRDVRENIASDRCVGEMLTELIDTLDYKERYLAALPDDADGGGGGQDVVWPVQHSAGARWECVQALLRRAHDFDDRFSVGHAGRRTDMFLRECHAYASARLAYTRARPQSEITLLTMHYAQAMEFDVVFISSLEHDSMPREVFCGNALEERKLLFLTILRARERVYFHYLDKEHANAVRDGDGDGDYDGQDDDSQGNRRSSSLPSFRRRQFHDLQRAPGGHSVFLNPVLLLLRRRGTAAQ